MRKLPRDLSRLTTKYYGVFKNIKGKGKHIVTNGKVYKYTEKDEIRLLKAGFKEYNTRL